MFGVRPQALAASAALYLVVLAGLDGLAAGEPPAPAGFSARDFDRRIAPLLARACLECHSAASKQGGLDLTRPGTARSGGTRGPAVGPGKPAASWLWKRVAADEMPPTRPLPAAEKALLKTWIAAGAPWGVEPVDPLRYTSDRRAGYDWWALQPVADPAPPQVRLNNWSANSIDRFVLAKLEAAGLRPAPPADRAALLRRLTFDVTGLPPTPEEIDAFLADRAADAYARVVDRLLASPASGERWARHWLDVIRFGESQGFERNKLRPNAWKYRDWVVEALNGDLPYDEFVRLQLAGDVLRPDDPLAVIATGFLVMGPYDLTAYTNGTASMQAAAREEELEGLVATVTQTFLGLTVNCARCHDHKFDPIPQKEYYQVAAALGGTYHGDERECLSPAGRPAAERERAALAAQAVDLRKRLAALEAPTRLERERQAGELGRLEARARLLAGGPAHVSVPKDPGVFHILERGDFRQRREPVAPAGLAAVAGLAPGWGLNPDAPEGERRRALAAWITDPKNPLAARVIVNRVWGHHFGTALVPTPNDFGFNGGRPSHPALLDHLAARLIQNRWSLEWLHREILLSSAYRQRRSPRRLEAEAVRDAALAVSGQLDRTLGGPGFRDWTVMSQGNNELYTVVDGVGPPYNRRTLYRTVVRAGTSAFLDVFDCPDPSVAAPRRTVTTTPVQALSLLHNAFMEHVARRFAERLEREAPGDPAGQVARAYRLAFGRQPAAKELRLGERLAAGHGMEQFCLVLMNANEFVYVD